MLCLKDYLLHFLSLNSKFVRKRYRLNYTFYIKIEKQKDKFN